MLNKSKKLKLLSALKTYAKKFLDNKITELDESGTRLMVNSFLTDVLGYIPIEEVKTEYMIKGTYADYVIQVKGIKHFLIEVKSLSLHLSDNHLRQAINYGANEGIDWVLLTNGKNFDFYKIIFGKPIESVKIFSIDLSDSGNIKKHADFIEFLCRDSVLRKGLNLLWNRTIALDPNYISGLLHNITVTNFIKRFLKKKFKTKFTDEEINNSIDKIISEAIDIEKIKVVKVKEIKKNKIVKDNSIDNQPNTPVISNNQTPF
jgi:hypothetical protein